MHRHGYKGRKLGRERDQRRALLKGLATSLVVEERIETTLPKAKELAHRRAVIAGLSTQAAAIKLVDQIAPQLSHRSSGHVRVYRTRLRRGDGAQMAVIEFVDELKPMPKPEATTKEAK